MHRNHLFTVLAFAMLSTTLAAPATAADPADAKNKPLAEAIEAIINAPQFKTAHWGVLVNDRNSGATLYEHQSDKMFAPASTTKLYSTAAALDEFEPDYRFRTPIYALGKIDNGRLDGNLVLVASGDLTMGGRTDAAGHIAFTNSDHIYAQFVSTAELTATDPLAGLNQLAKQVAAAGVRHISGDVLIDDRLFIHNESTGSGPDKVTPIMINDNLIDFVIEPTKPGQAAHIRWQPQTAAVHVDAQVETVGEKESTAVTIETQSDNRLIVRGRVSAGHKTLVRSEEVADPTSFARSLLIEALQRAGVQVDVSALSDQREGSLPEDRKYEGKQRLALLESPPFSENIKLILKVSHNLHASTLPLLIAAKHDERSLEAGMRRQHGFFHRAGVDVSEISFGGGAGGARSDYVSPRATVQLLTFMSKHKAFAAYRDGLPVLGGDGTLSKVVAADSPARGKVQAKTGTLLWDNLGNGRSLLTSKALAGYGTATSGRELAFALFVNNVQIDDSESGARHVGEVLGKISEAIIVNTPAN
jgi:D-alanyl-D-alanine carboxypeptidase/D-alanyl-D-alanine-endopeptidase (penicillin-binding protein 4)